MTTKEPAEKGPIGWLPWLIAGVAFALRALPYHEVFARGRVYFIESDAYYHLRRIRYAQMNFPDVLSFDRYLAFPDGAKAIWPAFVDAAIAWLLLPVVGANEGRALESAVVWIPPIVGTLTVLALYRLASRRFGGAVAAVAAGVLSVLSAHYWYSQLGFLDHHAFVALISTVLLATTMALLVSQRPVTRERSALRAAPIGVLSALLLLVWPGGILHVLLVELGLLGWVACADDRESALARVRAAAVVSGAALVLILPFSAFNEWPQWSAFSPVVLSGFQPLFFGTLLLFQGALAALWSRAATGFESRARLQLMLVLGGSLTVAGLILLPDLRTAALDAFEWLGRRDSFQSMVGESRPLFDLQGVFTVKIAELRLSRFFYLFPFALVWMVIVHRGRSEAPAVFFFACWAATLFVFTLLQKRFFNSFSISLALVFGWSCVQAFALLREHWRNRPNASARAGAMVGAMALLLLAPTFEGYLMPLETAISAWRGGPIVHDQRMRRNFARQDMAEWLRDNTPATAGLWDASLTPEYGVLARWGEGHFIKWAAQRPTAVGNFGDDLGRESFLRARSFYEAEPAEALALLDELGVRYVVIRSYLEHRPMAARLWRENGAGIDRIRLVHEVRWPGEKAGIAYKIFELLPKSVGDRVSSH